MRRKAQDLVAYLIAALIVCAAWQANGPFSWAVLALAFVQLALWESRSKAIQLQEQQIATFKKMSSDLHNEVHEINDKLSRVNLGDLPKEGYRLAKQLQDFQQAVH